MNNDIAVLDSTQVAKLIGRIDVLSAMRRMFLALGQEKAVQPPQLRNPFPNGQGNFISYLGTLAEERVFGAKLSPYIPRPEGALVTAWTLMMSMDDGQPRLLCDSGQLTAERTAGTTALAVDLLAPAQVSKLAVVGVGRLGQAHVRHVSALREWGDIRLYAPNIDALPVSEQQALRDLDPRISIHAELASAVDDADVILLCTSAGHTVLDPAVLKKPALITSICTNAPLAHEVPPESLLNMSVYCDYRATTPDSAGEMRLAKDQHGWLPESICGDLPELMTGAARLPDPERHTFFRSIGLGLEDIAIANELYQLHMMNN
ncbi:ornithine cyclodeaminase family protein [Pseudomonas synxantha]|uniref:L-arginine dehydrogenase n=1 Tax=Pseudomonas synxantha TaxID=47883 RepID=A0ACC6JL47_9PSED|nr:ornithine cyclodeaminase family protein [Pseudomonas synxantha]MDR6607236.1 L-arginine dehydrogenase [Pseudomonas synxantha]